MERETKTFKTPVSGIDIVYKSWISGGEMKALEAVFLKDAKLATGQDGKVQISGFSALMEQESEKKLIELLVVSVNGQKGNVVQMVDDLHVDDYKAIVKVLNEITGKKK